MPSRIGDPAGLADERLERGGPEESTSCPRARRRPVTSTSSSPVAIQQRRRAGARAPTRDLPPIPKRGEQGRCPTATAACRRMSTASPIATSSPGFFLSARCPPAGEGGVTSREKIGRRGRGVFLDHDGVGARRAIGAPGQDPHPAGPPAPAARPSLTGDDGACPPAAVARQLGRACRVGRPSPELVENPEQRARPRPRRGRSRRATRPSRGGRAATKPRWNSRGHTFDEPPSPAFGDR